MVVDIKIKMQAVCTKAAEGCCRPWHIPLLDGGDWAWSESGCCKGGMTPEAGTHQGGQGLLGDNPETGPWVSFQKTGET
jgi:hypothetical protein